jgi:leucyl/phenylalanyl-tRNA---protein transferase
MLTLLNTVLSLPLQIIRRARNFIPMLLQSPPARASNRAFRLVSWPIIATMQLLGLEEKSRVAFLWSRPTAGEVVDRYMRGYVLFGRETGHLAKLEWQSFDARAIATAETFRVPSRLRRQRRNSGLEVRFDQDFNEVAKACQEGRSDWTWLTDDLIDVYRMLFEQGLAATVGTYRDGELVGGLLGLSIGRTYSVMSIFHKENHAGSVAMAALEDVVAADGRWNIVDFGNMTPHNERFGAFLVSEREFLELLHKN